MKKMQFEKIPETFFIRVKCSGCGSEQTIFSNASRVVKCLACNQVLAEPGSGKIGLRAKVLESF